MNLLKAASTVSLLTLASRVTGLVREQLIAATFGASAATEAPGVALATHQRWPAARARHARACLR